MNLSDPTTMKLPNREQAHVPKRKLTAYLLSRAHPVGRSKARFFRQLGFDETNVEDLRQSLRKVARRAEIDEAEQTPHGTKYAVVGSVHTPDGDSVRVRTVWIIESEEEAPRFVTAYPA